MKHMKWSSIPPNTPASDGAPKVEGVTPAGVPCNSSPPRPKRDGSPSEDVVQAEHQKLVQKLIEDRKKADAASALEHAATASSTAPKGKPSGEIPDSNIYIRER